MDVFNPTAAMNPPGGLYPSSLSVLRPAPTLPVSGLTWPRPASFANPVAGYPLKPSSDRFSDTFSRVTEGSLQPVKDDPSYVMPVEIATNGAIVQKTLIGPERIGQLDAQGNFTLSNGLAGNIFREGALTIGYQHNDNPLMTALRTTEQQRATLGSEVMHVRQSLTAKGWDGRGVKIGILDAYESLSKSGINDEGFSVGGGNGAGGNHIAGSDIHAQKRGGGARICMDEGSISSTRSHSQDGDFSTGWQVHDHSYAVGSVMNDPVWGVAPGAQVIDAGFRMPNEPETDRDNLQVYISDKLKGYCQIYDHTARQLYNVMRQADPALRVLSLTWGSSRVKMYMDALVELNAKDEQGRYKSPVLRNAILGNTRYGSLDDKVQAVIGFVDSLCDSPAMQQAHQRYIEATRQLAARGITLCVAAGNDHGMMDSTAQFPPGAEFNDLAKSPYVIAVAASDTSQTPGYRQDDRLAAFSSRGDGALWNPTIAAPGQEVRVNRPYGGIGQNLAINGTSYATPYVAAVVSMMIQKNPWLRFDQVKSLLQGTAIPLQGATLAETGAGAINPEQAVLSA